MVFLAAAALGAGLITAIAVAPISALAALLTAPLVASLAAVLAGAVLARHRTIAEAAMPDLDAQADAMVGALKDVAGSAQRSSSAPVRDHEAA